MTKHHSSSNNNSSNINRSTTSNYTNSSHTKKAFKAFHNKKHSRDRVPDTATSSTIVVATDSCQKEQKLTKQQKRDLKRNQKAIEARAITSNNNREQQNNVCSVYKRKTVYPPVMKDFKGPRGRFLNPTDADFVNVLQRCYRGFACERKETFSLEFHSKFRMAFEGLEEDEAYQFDMTQPAGLGTKLAKTFVTRCLVGEPGTTYKYLGLRMFALPWSKEAKGSTPHTVAIGEVNNALIERSDALLKKSGSELYGSCRYNLTLINRCYPENSAGSSVIKLKDEPVFKNEKCSVSWHADSTLEHFSTIAVYHYTKHDQKKSDSFASDDESWRIALRLWYDAEGPNMGKSHSKSSEMKDNFVAPLLAYPLPNQSAYFLLDDFNHHHQHSVLVGNTHRYASTHRVCRQDGHTFQSIRNRCISALQRSSGNQYGAKQLRTEQLTLNEVEFEWIRQFYIQGSKHKDLHVWWHDPMAELEKQWEELQLRAVAAIKVLYDASVGEEKLKSLQRIEVDEVLVKKAKKQIANRIKRASSVETRSYDVMAELLVERHEKRQGWKARETDGIFSTLPMPCRPIVRNERSKDECGFEEFLNSIAPSSDVKEPLLSLSKLVLQWKKDFELLNT